jgi:hypothetical protein
MYQHCDKFLSQLTLIMHFRTIIAAKILLSSNPTVMIMDKLARLFNSRYDHVTVLQSAIVIWKWQFEHFASDMQLDITDFVVTAYLCPLKPVIFCSLLVIIKYSACRDLQNPVACLTVSPESGDCVVLF